MLFTTNHQPENSINIQTKNPPVLLSCISLWLVILIFSLVILVVRFPENKNTKKTIVPRTEVQMETFNSSGFAVAHYQRLKINWQAVSDKQSS